MWKKFLEKRPSLSLPQILILLAVVAGLFIALDLNRRAQAGQMVGVGEADLQREVAAEATRQVELEATLTYVQSEDFVANYARNEAGQVLPGEKRVVPLPIEATPAPTPSPAPTPDPVHQARPWQAWWRLLSDAPLPTP
jgi:cell division protein FtsB